MHGIRFWHGAAMALIVVGALSIVTGVGALVRASGPDRVLAAWLAVLLGAVTLSGSSWYLYTTLDEAELPDDAREDLGIEAEE